MPNQYTRPALALGAVCLFALFYAFPGTFRQHRPIGDNDVFDEYETRIVALGDLHGDLPHALRTLKMSGVIDKDRKWTGHVDVLVQTGDIIDRQAVLYCISQFLRII